MSLYDWLPSLFAPLLLLCGAYLSTHVIPHGACRVFYHRGGSGERLVLPAGVRVCNPLVWAPLRGPLYGIIADDFFPVPGTILDIPIPFTSFASFHAGCCSTTPRRQSRGRSTTH